MRYALALLAPSILAGIAVALAALYWGGRDIRPPEPEPPPIDWARLL